MILINILLINIFNNGYTFKLKENGKSSKRIFTTFIDNNELWVGGFDGPVKHYINNVLISTYKTGNARCIVAGEDHIL